MRVHVRVCVCVCVFLSLLLSRVCVCVCVSSLLLSRVCVCVCVSSLLLSRVGGRVSPFGCAPRVRVWTRSRGGRGHHVDVIERHTRPWASPTQAQAWPPCSSSHFSRAQRTGCGGRARPSVYRLMGRLWRTWQQCASTPQAPHRQHMCGRRRRAWWRTHWRSRRGPLIVATLPEHLRVTIPRDLSMMPTSCLGAAASFPLVPSRPSTSRPRLGRWDLGSCLQTTQLPPFHWMAGAWC